MSKRRNGNGHHHRDLAGLIDVYLLRCEVEGKSPNTLHAYAETLRRFAAAAQEEGFPSDVSRIAPAHLYSYLGRFTGYSLETRHRYFREVRCFFNWLVAADYLKETPFRSLHNVRLPQKIVQPFNGEEIASLLACCDSETTAVARSTTREIAGGRDSTEKALTNSRRLRSCHRWSNRFATAPYAAVDLRAGHWDG